MHMDVVTLLREDHDRVRELFRKYRGGGGLSGLVKRVTGAVAAREQRAAVRKICDELDVHALVEEEIFYPAVRGTGDAELRKQVEEGVSEHGKIKQQIAALRPRLDDVERCANEVGELESCVEHHASEEEKEMFPRLEQVMPEGRRDELAREIRARKKGLMPRAAVARAASGRAAARKTGKVARGRKAKAAARTRVRGRARMVRAKRARVRKASRRPRKRA
jgi:hemerythrin superfamily protein